MSKKMNMGFTLIEMTVVVGIIGLLMLIISEIMIGSFKLRTKMKYLDILQNNAFFVQSEVRKNILESYGDSIVCSSSVGVGGSSVEFMNSGDGIKSVIVCKDLSSSNRVASISARETVDLLNTTVTSGVGVSVMGCNNFVKCIEAGMKKQVEFNYILKVGSVGNGMSLPFSFKLTTRN